MDRLYMRAALKLEPGARLLFDSPNMSQDDYKADEFFRKYHQRHAVFVRYGERYVGLDNWSGVMPGRYVDYEHAVIRFDGEDKDQGVNPIHLVVVGPGTVELAAHFDERVGDLDFLFYPDDTVAYREDLLATPHVVDRVHVERGGSISYQIPSRFRVEGHELKLLSAGNIRWLYTDPSKLSFSSDTDEALFWMNRGVMRQVLRGSADDVRRAFAEGAADFVSPVSEEPIFTTDHGKKQFTAHRLHDCFAQHRDRVRALSHRMPVFELAEA